MLYLKIPHIAGTATATGYKDWLPIQTVDFACNRYLEAEFDYPENYQFGCPYFDDLMITREPDAATPALMSLSWDTICCPEIYIDQCAAAERLKPYLQLRLTKVAVSGYHLVQEARKPAKEVINFQFEQVQSSYIDYQESQQQMTTAYFQPKSLH